MNLANNQDDSDLTIGSFESMEEVKYIFSCTSSSNKRVKTSKNSPGMKLRHNSIYNAYYAKFTLYSDCYI